MDGPRDSSGRGSHALGATYRLALAVREAGPPRAPKPRTFDRLREPIRAHHHSGRTAEEPPGRRDVNPTAIDTHALNRGRGAGRSPADRMFGE